VKGKTFMTQLTGKVAIVTGASQGLGYAIAERLSKDGASVIVNYNKSEDKAKELVATITSRGGRAVAVRADVSQPVEISNLFASCIEQFGRPDILVINAGMQLLIPLSKMTEEAFDTMFNANSKSALFCLKEAALHLNDGGRIVMIASGATFFPAPDAYLYSGSKATLAIYAKIAADELGQRGITVNTIAPGLIETNMLSLVPQAIQDMVTNLSPFHRLGRPSDIADTVAFITSDDARWISGEHILVNGGAHR
jgi:3-oxoacyl-[acyl-carrier protein] reductase